MDSNLCAFDYIVTIYDDRLGRNLEICANLDSKAQYETQYNLFYVDAEPTFCDYTVFDLETGSSYEMPYSMKASVDVILQNLYWDRLDNETV